VIYRFLVFWGDTATVPRPTTPTCGSTADAEIHIYIYLSVAPNSAIIFSGDEQ